MSGVDWSNILCLPDMALAGSRRIPKTTLVKQAMLTKTEQKRLDKVARLEHFATVQKSTTRIPPYEDGERNVQSIVFLLSLIHISRTVCPAGQPPQHPEHQLTSGTC